MFNKINSKRLIALFCTLCLIFTACFAGGMSVSADTTLTDVTSADLGQKDTWVGAGDAPTNAYAKQRAAGWANTRMTWYAKIDISPESTSGYFNIYLGTPSYTIDNTKGIYFQFTKTATNGWINGKCFGTSIGAKLSDYAGILDGFHSKDRYVKYCIETIKLALDDDGVENDLQFNFYIDDVLVVKSTAKDKADELGKWWGFYTQGTKYGTDTHKAYINSCYPIATDYEDCEVWSLKSLGATAASYTNTLRTGNTKSFVNTAFTFKLDTGSTGNANIGYINIDKMGSAGSDAWTQASLLVFDLTNDVLYTSTGHNINTGRNKVAYYPSDFGLTTFKGMSKVPVTVYIRQRSVDGTNTNLEVTPEINGVKGVPTYYARPTAELLRGAYMAMDSGATATMYDNTPVILEKLNVANYDHKFTFSTLADIEDHFVLSENGNGGFGKLSNDDITVSAADYDKVLLTGYVKLTANSVIWALAPDDDTGRAYQSGVEIAFTSDGSKMWVNPVNNLSFGGAGILAADCGLDNFFNNDIKFQMSLDKVADGLQIGLWFNGVLAGNIYFKVTDVTNLGSAIRLKDIEYVSAHYFDDLAVFGKYVEVEAGAVSYEVTGTVKNAVTGADVTGPITTRGDFTVEDTAGAKEAVILWTAYDVSPDGEVNVKDLVALKKYAAEIDLETKSGAFAASKLDGATSLLAISQYIVGIITELP